MFYRNWCLKNVFLSQYLLSFYHNIVSNCLLWIRPISEIIFGHRANFNKKKITIWDRIFMLKGLHKKAACEMMMKYTLGQVCTTYGPRAKCGPRKLLLWACKAQIYPYLAWYLMETQQKLEKAKPSFVARECFSIIFWPAMKSDCACLP